MHLSTTALKKIMNIKSKNKKEYYKKVVECFLKKAEENDRASKNKFKKFKLYGGKR